MRSSTKKGIHDVRRYVGNCAAYVVIRVSLVQGAFDAHLLAAEGVRRKGIFALQIIR